MAVAAALAGAQAGGALAQILTADGELNFSKTMHWQIEKANVVDGHSFPEILEFFYDLTDESNPKIVTRYLDFHNGHSTQMYNGATGQKHLFQGRNPYAVEKRPAYVEGKNVAISTTFPNGDYPNMNTDVEKLPETDVIILTKEEAEEANKAYQLTSRPFYCKLEPNAKKPTVPVDFSKASVSPYEHEEVEKAGLKAWVIKTDQGEIPIIVDPATGQPVYLGTDKVISASNDVPKEIFEVPAECSVPVLLDGKTDTSDNILVLQHQAYQKTQARKQEASAPELMVDVAGQVNEASLWDQVEKGVRLHGSLWCGWNNEFGSLPSLHFLGSAGGATNEGYSIYNGCTAEQFTYKPSNPPGQMWGQQYAGKTVEYFHEYGDWNGNNLDWSDYKDDASKIPWVIRDNVRGMKFLASSIIQNPFAIMGLYVGQLVNILTGDGFSGAANAVTNIFNMLSITDDLFKGWSGNPSFTPSHLAWHSSVHDWRQMQWANTGNNAHRLQYCRAVPKWKAINGGDSLQTYAEDMYYKTTNFGAYKAGLQATALLHYFESWNISNGGDPTEFDVNYAGMYDNFYLSGGAHHYKFWADAITAANGVESDALIPQIPFHQWKGSHLAHYFWETNPYSAGYQTFISPMIPLNMFNDFGVPIYFENGRMSGGTGDDSCRQHDWCPMGDEQAEKTCSCDAHIFFGASRKKPMQLFSPTTLVILRGCYNLYRDCREWHAGLVGQAVNGLWGLVTAVVAGTSDHNSATLACKEFKWVWKRIEERKYSPGADELHVLWSKVGRDEDTAGVCASLRMPGQGVGHKDGLDVLAWLTQPEAQTANYIENPTQTPIGVDYMYNGNLRTMLATNPHIGNGKCDDPILKLRTPTTYDITVNGHLNTAWVASAGPSVHTIPSSQYQYFNKLIPNGPTPNPHILVPGDYNNDVWGYDGGDCCAETCRDPSNPPSYACTGPFNCKQPACDNKGSSDCIQVDGMLVNAAIFETLQIVWSTDNNELQNVQVTNPNVEGEYWLQYYYPIHAYYCPEFVHVNNGWTTDITDCGVPEIYQACGDCVQQGNSWCSANLLANGPVQVWSSSPMSLQNVQTYSYSGGSSVIFSSSASSLTDVSTKDPYASIPEDTLPQSGYPWYSMQAYYCPEFISANNGYTLNMNDCCVTSQVYAYTGDCSSLPDGPIPNNNACEPSTGGFIYASQQPYTTGSTGILSYDSTTVVGFGTNFQSNWAGHILKTSSGVLIGQIASVASTNQLTLTQPSAVTHNVNAATGMTLAPHPQFAMGSFQIHFICAAGTELDGDCNCVPDWENGLTVAQADQPLPLPQKPITLPFAPTPVSNASGVQKPALPVHEVVETKEGTFLKFTYTKNIKKTKAAKSAARK